MVNGDQYTCLVKGACKARLQTELRTSIALGCDVGVISRIDRSVESLPGILIRVDLESQSR